MIDSANRRWTALCALTLGLAVAQDTSANAANVPPHALPSKMIAASSPHEYRMPLSASPSARTVPDRLPQKCTTNTADETWPPNPTIAVGHTQFMVATQSNISLYDRATCALLASATPNTFFTNIAPGDFLFGALVTYDPVGGRFIVVSNAFTSSGGQALYIAASEQPDFPAERPSAFSPFFEYRFDLGRLAGTLLDLVATPYHGTDEAVDQLGVTGTVVDQSGGKTGQLVFTDLFQMESGQQTTAVEITTPGPVDSSHEPFGWKGALGDFVLYFLSGASSIGNIAAAAKHRSTETTTVELPRFRLTFGSTPADDTMKELSPVTVPASDPPPNAKQPNGQKLLTGDGSFTSPGVQIGNRVWLVHTVNDGGFARPEVLVLPTKGTTPITVFRLSSVPEQNDNLFNLSIAVNGSGQKVHAFINATRTIPSDPKAGKPAMVILDGPALSGTGWTTHVIKTSPRQFTTGNTGQRCNQLTGLNACRWGANSSIQLDPLNQHVVWGVNELAGTETLGGPNWEFDWDVEAGKIKQ